MERLTITLEQDEDGVWIAECTTVEGCVSQGATEDEALRNLADALRECLDVRAERAHR